MLPQTMPSLYAVQFKNYSELDFQILEQELSKIRFSMQQKLSQSPKQQEFDSYLQEKMDQLEEQTRQVMQLKDDVQQLRQQNSKLQIDL